MNKISSSVLMSKVDPHFDLNKNVYEMDEFPARKLLTNNRFDLSFKLMFLHLYEVNPSFAEFVYLEHIRALSMGKFKEPGNDSKSSAEKFLSEFKTVFNSIKKNGFDIEKTLIPLSSNGTIVNGSHRTASAIYLDKTVGVVDLGTPDHIYDYRFFYNRNVKEYIIDQAAVEFIEFADNVFIAFLWPVANDKSLNLESLIPNIVYKKNIKLNPLGAHNLLAQIYSGEPWLGSVDNNFKGVQGKLVECFKSFEAFSVVAFQADDINQVLEVKDKIRELAGIGKHSVHITDTKTEALRCARTVFNENSIHFLNHAKPNKYLSFRKKLMDFTEALDSLGIERDLVTLDSGMVLSAYGLRECNDVDILAVETKSFNRELFYQYDAHDSELESHGVNKLDLVLNPKYYFYYEGVKFVSFSQVYKMKEQRGEFKDQIDFGMMKALIENDKKKILWSNIKQSIVYKLLTLRFHSLKVLKVLRLYKVVRFIYRLVKGQKND